MLLRLTCSVGNFRVRSGRAVGATPAEVEEVEDIDWFDAEGKISDIEALGICYGRAKPQG